ncbi:MAG: HdeD family acid-resistance protein [Phycisphaeraceae bacterium]|nr:HdeD family acid-resistance protein [Phycisphaeraceae bacterium]
MTQVATSPPSVGSAPHLHALAMGWKLLLFRGICAIAFGAIAVTMPLPTIATLIWMVAAFCVIDGVFALVAAISGRAKAYAPTWWLVLVGVLGIVAGIAIFEFPGVAGLLMLKFIAFFAIFRGVFEIVGAIQLRKVIRNEWVLILGGLIDIAFGVYVLAFPGQSALAMVMVLGIFAIISGVSLVALSMRLKKHATA